MDTTDVSKLPTSGPPVNQPSSGTYGEGAALDRLKSALPQAKPAQPGAPAPSPMPQPPGGQGMPGSPPPGVPQGLLAPTQRPDVPVGTPLALPPVNPVAAAQTGRQRNLAVLDALANNPDASEVTRQWAKDLIDTLVARSTA